MSFQTLRNLSLVPEDSSVPRGNPRNRALRNGSSGPAGTAARCISKRRAAPSAAATRRSSSASAGASPARPLGSTFQAGHSPAGPLATDTVIPMSAGRESFADPGGMRPSLMSMARRSYGFWGEISGAVSAMTATASSVASASIAIRLSAYCAATRRERRLRVAGGGGVRDGGRGVQRHRQGPSLLAVRILGSMTEYAMSTTRLMVMNSITITIR